jgi:hypothetical protein
MKKSLLVVGSLGLSALVNCVCFVRGTRIVTPRGMRRIEDLVVGDEVFSMNIETRTPVVRKVEKLLRSHAKQLVHVAVGELVVVGVTPEHPFYDAERRAWVPAAELRKGTNLTAWLGSANVRDIEVSEHRTLEVAGSVEVFNLTIEGPEHNYFAEGLLVHNKDVAVTGTDGAGGTDFIGELCESDADCAPHGLFCERAGDGQCGPITTKTCQLREGCDDIPLQTVCGCDGQLHATHYQCPGDDQVNIDKRPDACAPPAGQFNCGTGRCNIETEYCLEDFTEIKCVELPAMCQGAMPTCGCLGENGISTCECSQWAMGGVTVRACK